MNGFVIFNGTMTIINLAQFIKTGDLPHLVLTAFCAAVTGFVYDNPTK